MVVKILGSDLKSRIVYESALKAIEDEGLEAEVERVTDIDEIVKMGVMMTPAIIVDDVPKAAGRIFKQQEIISILNGEKVSNCFLCPGSSLPGSCSCCS